MKRIRIEPGDGWTLYKRDTPVPAGEYFLYEGRPSEVVKKQLALLAVTPPPSARLGPFARLAPAAEWVGWVLSGGVFVPETSRYGLNAPEELWDILDFDPERLRPWQRRFVEDAYNALSVGYNYRRAALVSLGGGKSLAALLLTRLGERALIVAPKHVHSTWRDQAERWGIPCPPVTTPESSHRYTDDLDVLVIDELLGLKNPEALRSQKVRTLSKKASVVVGLTGTPTSAGGPLDWRHLDVVRPGCVPDKPSSWQFLFSEKTELKKVRGEQKAYVTPPTSWDTEKIAAFVAPHVMRVDTSELLAHLPPIEFRRIMLPTPKDYEIVKSGAASERGRSKVSKQLQMLSDGHIFDDQGVPIWLHRDKINAVSDFVENLGEPVVLVAAWTETVAELGRTLKHLNPAVVIGDAGDAVARFRNRSTSVLILPAAKSTGIDGLQDRARVVCFLSNSTNPTDREQTIGRLFRPGQDRGVVVVDFLSEGTLDERALDLITNHKHLSQAMIDRILAEEL